MPPAGSQKKKMVVAHMGGMKGGGSIRDYLFICGAADRSGRGKRCCCCCWGGRGTIFQTPMYSFLGCDKAKTLSKKGCDKAKTLSQKGCDKAKTLSQKGCDKAKTLSQNGCEKTKTLSIILFSTPQISESIPFLFHFKPFIFIFKSFCLPSP